jgi:uncharacterized protein (TIGR03792 family)
MRPPSFAVGQTRRMFPERPGAYRYTREERLPVEILVFQVDPDDVEEYLRVDHEVWTLGEAFHPELDHIPFVSKEVWLNDARPGEITLIFVFESMEAWNTVGADHIQAQLIAEFDRRFGRPHELVRAVHEEERFGIHRWSRFERTEPIEPTAGG